jgi:hypothetical protein
MSCLHLSARDSFIELLPLLETEDSVSGTFPIVNHTHWR